MREDIMWTLRDFMFSHEFCSFVVTLHGSYNIFLLLKAYSTEIHFIYWLIKRGHEVFKGHTSGKKEGNDPDVLTVSLGILLILC